VVKERIFIDQLKRVKEKIGYADLPKSSGDPRDIPFVAAAS